VGLLRRQLGRIDDAVASLEQAHAAAPALQAPLIDARLQLDLAETLRPSGTSATAKRASQAR